MARLEVPLLGRTLWATGDFLLRGELTLLVKTNRQTWEPLIFLADSGTEMTTVPAARAAHLDIPMPQAPVPGLLHQPTGQEVRGGFLRVQVAGLGSREFAFPCYFLGDPHAPATAAPKGSRNLLGLTGVVDKLRISFDGTPSPSAPVGMLLVEEV
jgi:hypothetical protein